MITTRKNCPDEKDVTSGSMITSVMTKAYPAGTEKLLPVIVEGLRGIVLRQLHGDEVDESVGGYAEVGHDALLRGEAEGRGVITRWRSLSCISNPNPASSQ